MSSRQSGFSRSPWLAVGILVIVVMHLATILMAVTHAGLKDGLLLYAQLTVYVLSWPLLLTAALATLAMPYVVISQFRRQELLAVSTITKVVMASNGGFALWMLAGFFLEATTGTFMGRPA